MGTSHPELFRRFSPVMAVIVLWFCAGVRTRQDQYIETAAPARDEVYEKADRIVVKLDGEVAADAADDAGENADLRISHVFPSQAEAIEIAVASGEYRVSVDYWNGKTLWGRSTTAFAVFFPNS